MVNMVPCGYWMQQKIDSTTKAWHQLGKANAAKATEELQLAEIKPAEYKAVSIDDIVQKQTHLNPTKCSQLQEMLSDFQDLFQGQRGNYNGEPIKLSDFQDLFQGQIGNYNGEPIKLELLPWSKPFYAKPFSIPKAYQQLMRDEIARLESIGLLTKVPAAEWAAPTFIIPKKDQTVRVITDCRGLKKFSNAIHFPCPKSQIFFGVWKSFVTRQRSTLTWVITRCLYQKNQKSCV
jgi:hypothetical protein